MIIMTIGEQFSAGLALPTYKDNYGPLITEAMEIHAGQGYMPMG